MFCRYALRTLDVEAARQFYQQALGLALQPCKVSSTSNLELWPLHERARAMGAPPHWLGQIAVRDLDSMIERLRALGSEPLGPSVDAGNGVRFAALRDPFGAVMAVRSGGHAPDDHPVAWHQLHTRDRVAAWAMYRDLFGWASLRTLETPAHADHIVFAWRAAGEAVGSVANSARHPGVHTHWLFYFPVDDLDACVARVRTLGGTAFDPLDLTDSVRLSACEDAQGAAFGLIARGGLPQR